MLPTKTKVAVNSGIVKHSTHSRSSINLWVVLVAFLLLATCFIAAIFFHWFTELGSTFNELANFECDNAISAYESGGPHKLESVMQRHETQSGVRAYLFDGNGHNLGDGPDRTSILSVKPLYLRALSRLRGERIRSVDARVVPQTSKYQCIIVTSDLENRAFYGNRAVRLLGFLAIICYGAVGYLILRLRYLEAAIRSFGAGKLEIRVSSGSRDPIRGLSEAFNEMAHQVETLVQAHKRLCIDVSHELRSPLTRLRLAIGLARSGTDGALEQIELESVRVNELIDQLLDLARAEVDPTTLRCEPIDMEALITEVVDDCTIEASERGCELDLRIDRPGAVLGDPELLRRAIENPLRNAIRHSPAGAAVELVCNGNAEFVVVSIRDFGPGVPDPALQEIFKPFYRVEADRDTTTVGSGLGLAISERAVALHQGSVTAENSTPGLKIEIRLPRRG